MKINALMLNHLIAKSNLQMDDRKYLIAIALSKNIAYDLALPTSAVESASKWFADNHRTVVENFLSEVNEMTVINIQECYELAFKIWKMRYQIVYDVKSIDVINFLDAQFYNGSDQIPEIYREVYGRLGFDLVNGFVNEVGTAIKYAEHEGV